MRTSNAVALACLLAGACGSKEEPDFGYDAGSLLVAIELVEGTPVDTCIVVLEGTPFGTRCEGNFAELVGVPEGVWDLRATANDERYAEYAPARTAAAVESGERTQLDITLFKSGAIFGNVVTPNPASALVMLPEQGAVVSPTSAGTYVVQGAWPGESTVSFISGASVGSISGVEVPPGGVVGPIDFGPNGFLETPGTLKIEGSTISGRKNGLSAMVWRRDTGLEMAAESLAATVEVELPAGPYVVGATDSQTGITLYRTVFVTSTQVTTARFLLPDNTGPLPNGNEDDYDGDGVDNDNDGAPYDPGASDPIDDYPFPDDLGLPPVVITTDGDEDGIPDAIDNCPLIANEDQADANQDGQGNACDPTFFQVIAIANDMYTVRDVCASTEITVGHAMVSNSLFCSGDADAQMVFRNLAVPAGATLVSATLALLDNNAGTATPITVTVSVDPTNLGNALAIPTSYSEADGLKSGGVSEGSFLEDDASTLHTVNVKTTLQTLVNNPAYLPGQSDFRLFLAGPEVGAVLYDGPIVITIEIEP